MDSDYKSYLKIVQEKVDLSKPKVPQTSASGGIIIPKLKNQTEMIMIAMLIFVYIFR